MTILAQLLVEAHIDRGLHFRAKRARRKRRDWIPIDQLPADLSRVARSIKARPGKYGFSFSHDMYVYSSTGEVISDKGMWNQDSLEFFRKHGKL